MPFDRYNNEHVEFGFSYADMIGRMPSEFRNLSDAARAYVRLFMVRKREDETDKNSDFNKVLGDLSSCRELIYNPKIVQELTDFFLKT